MKYEILIVAAVSTAACAPPQRGVPIQPSATKTSPATTNSQTMTQPALGQPPVANLCFNTDYRLTCVIPDGFIMTEESSGPGKIMNMVQRALRSDLAANLSLSAHKIGPAQTLDLAMSVRYLQELKSAKGVTRVDSSTAAYGNTEGFEIYVERQYASGAFKSKTFGFLQRPNLFVTDYTAPAEFFDRNPDTIKRFVESISFDQSR